MSTHEKESRDMNSIAENNIDTLNTDAALDAEIVNGRRNLNLSIARALANDPVLMAAVDLTAINADQRPQDADEIAYEIRGIVGTLVAAAGYGSNGHPIAKIIEEADVCYDPDEIAAEVAWYVTLI